MDKNHRHGASDPGTVMLELGGDVGALIVHTGPERHGDEIEIVALSAGGARTHAEVRERRLPDSNVYCAVYYGLAAGEYTVEYGAGHNPTVTITGGTVTELRPS